jgi:hypothetical protein
MGDDANGLADFRDVRIVARAATSQIFLTFWLTKKAGIPAGLVCWRYGK